VVLDGLLLVVPVAVLEPAAESGCDGASRSQLIALGFSGHNPDSLNEFTMVDAFTQSSHAFLNTGAKVYFVRGIPGFSNL